MPGRKKYTLRFTREADCWAARVIGARGVLVRSRSIPGARVEARRALSHQIGKAASSVELVDDMHLPAAVLRSIDQHFKEQEKLEAAQDRADAAKLTAARKLRRLGLTLRDIGVLLGMSAKGAFQVLRRG